VAFISPKTLCHRQGLIPKKSLGQHFLLHPDTARRIVAALELTGRELVVEIGAGLGALTTFLAEQARQVIALEIDRPTAEILRSAVLTGIPNVEVAVQDVLDFDFAAASRSSGEPVTVTGNLPYQITSSLFFKLVEYKTILGRMVFMVQREVGDRLLAVPGGKAYGRLSVLLQYHFHLERLFSLSPGHFYPPPRVDSLVIRLEPAVPPVQVMDEAHLARLVKLAFSTRRKTLKNTLAARAGEMGAASDQVLAALARHGIDSQRRAETLTVEDFVNLSNALSRQADGG